MASYSTFGGQPHRLNLGEQIFRDDDVLPMTSSSITGSVSNVLPAVFGGGGERMEVVGTDDGPPILLPSGIRLYRQRMGRAQVSAAELEAVIRAITMLPRADQLAIARLGIPIRLIPTAGLEDSFLGATTIVSDPLSGRWVPTQVRIAVRAGRSGMGETGEIAQHELGHVLAVTRYQDRSEAAAERYALTH